MLSRGLSYDDALASIVVTGDEAVARGALDIIAPILGRPDE